MKDRHFNYIKDITRYERQKTWEVKIGEVGVGGDNPIRIQSMTDTSTKETEPTVEQIIALAKAGADYVRCTVKGIYDAENLKNIVDELRNRGYTTPLVADIHFNPRLADIAAKYFDKVRINPGNFYDKRARFEAKIYSDEEYKEELLKIEEQFIPFLEMLERNQYGAAHWRQPRLTFRQGNESFGDSPSGMAESVLEFLRICKKVDFKNVVVSIKSSNTRMMVYTVRLLNYKMRLEDMKYPIHLGVTEAGEGEDGRIKSAVGNGALLADGIGDTIRVSLTEIR
jgi:(E)-4-hydroxy-3-methylbut-2-enyl-diphosphate synthase